MSSDLQAAEPPSLVHPGKVAVVTGAASGIGLALAQAFAAAGMHVLLADVEHEALQRAAQGIAGDAASSTNGRIVAQVCDVTRPEQVDALAEQAFSTFGAVHVLCNNAGVTGRFAPVWEQTDAEWRWVFAVNVLGLANGARSFVPRMLAQGDAAHIVNTVSEAAFAPRPFVGVYHASKFAALGLTENLAQDLQIAGANIRVSALCPGAVNTRVMQAARNRPAEIGAPAPPSNAAAQSLLDNYNAALAKGMSPAEVAACVLDSIRSGRFYVFPHDDVRTRQLARAQAIADHRYPDVNPGLAAQLSAASGAALRNAQPNDPHNEQRS